MEQIKHFSQAIANKIKHYVYLYIDPRDGEVFYVGKGQRNRCFEHLAAAGEGDKAKRIRAIQADGQEPRIEVAAHGLDEETAFKVEAAVIDSLDVKKLTNQQKGHGSAKYGRMPLDQLVSLYQPEKAVITEPSVLFTLTRDFFNYSMSEQERYDATRQFWRVAKEKRDKIQLAFAVFDRQIQEVYEVRGWYPGCSTFSTKKASAARRELWEFVGNVAEEQILKKYRYKSTANYPSTRGGIRYVNIP